MSFYWPDYHKLAQDLIKDPKFLAENNEATLRTVVSRSYYSAFKVSFNYLRDVENINPQIGDNAHWFVINQFKRSQNPLKKTIGNYLDRMRELRNLADYEDDFYEQLARVNYTLQRTEVVFENLRILTS